MIDRLKRMLGLSDTASPAEASAIVGLPFPYELVLGRTALDERTSKLGTGITPILMGEATDLALLLEVLTLAQESPEEIIASASSVDLDAWMRKRHAEDPDFYSAPSASWPTERMDPVELSIHLNTLSQHRRRKSFLGSYQRQTLGKCLHT